MATPRFDHERAACILAEAAIHGDKFAAARANVSIRSIVNYRKRLESDDKLAQAFLERHRELTKEWMPEAIKVMNIALARMGDMVVKTKKFSEVKQAVEVVGDALATCRALGIDASTFDSVQGGAPEATPSQVRKTELH
jgi:hypothetical protein